MARVPSISQIALWKLRASQLDQHLGYHPKNETLGPCSFVIEELEDAGYFTDLVDTDFVEDFLFAVRHIVDGTSINQFLRHTSQELDREFDSWMAEVSQESASTRQYLTNELRSSCLDTVLKIDLHPDLNRQQIKEDQARLKRAVDQYNETDPEWGARYCILRIYESMLVHIAWHHPKTRKRLLSIFKGDKDATKRSAYARKAKIEARDSVRRWRAALGYITPKRPGLHLIRGGKL